MEELATTAKRIGSELIDMSGVLAREMRNWAELLAENPDIVVATYSAGFISDPAEAHRVECVIDVQNPPSEAAVLRTWAIETVTNPDGRESSNNIQLTFAVDEQRAETLLAKGNAITREDLRAILHHGTTQIADITVSNEFSGDGVQQTTGERYAFTANELSQDPDQATAIAKTLEIVVQKLKQACSTT